MIYIFEAVEISSESDPEELDDLDDLEDIQVDDEELLDLDRLIQTTKSTRNIFMYVYRGGFHLKASVDS